MNPIFFPFTWIPESIQRLLLACFKQVVICQPARELVPEPLLRLERDGRLDIRLPDAETVDDLPHLLTAYHAWAELHRGERPDFHKFAAFHGPGPDEVTTDWIRSKIRNPAGKKTGRQNAPADSGTDPLRMARLFLAVAQEYDQQDESLSRDLHHIDTLGKNLLQNLAPDRESSEFITPGPPFPAEAGATRPMPAERLAAWRRLYTHCRSWESALSPLFVTSSQEALQLMLAPMDTPEMVCRIVNIPPREEKEPFAATPAHQRIDEQLLAAVHGDPLSSPSNVRFTGEKTAPEGTGSLVLYRVKGNPVAAHLSGPGNIPELSERIMADAEHPCSLVGHIQ